MLEEPQVTIRILPVMGKLEFERHCLQVAISLQHMTEQRAAHRARCSGGADQVTAAEGSVDHITVSVRANLLDSVLHELGAGVLQQPSIELEAPDGMLNARQRHVQSQHVPMNAPEAQEPEGVGLDLEPQITDDLRRYPARTEFVAREALLVEHQNVRAGGFQTLGGCGTGGTTADDYDLGVSHGVAAYVGYMNSRVSGMELFSCLVNSTWKSCIEPVSKPAIEPARYSRHIRTNDSS